MACVPRHNRHAQSRRINRRQVEQILRRLAYAKLYANSIRAGSLATGRNAD